MASLTVYSSSGDGNVENTTTDFSAGGWTTLRSDSSGKSLNYTNVSAALRAVGNATPRVIDRVFLFFDTSSLPDDCTVTAVDLYLYTVSTSYSGHGPHHFVIVDNSVSTTTSLSLSDYSNVGSSLLSSAQDINTLVTNAYTTISLNSTGIAAVSLTGYTKFAIRVYNSSGGIEDEETSDQAVSAYFSTSEDSNVDHRPKLVITYNPNTTTSTTTSTTTTTTSTSTTTTSTSTTTSTTTTVTSTSTSTTTTSTSSTSTSSTSTSTSTSTTTTITTTSTTVPYSIAVDGA